MADERIEIIKNDEVAELLDKRGIRDDDIREVISYGENTGYKLYCSERYLAKKRLGEFTVYVEYKPAGDGYEIFTAYAHRVQLKSDMKIWGVVSIMMV